MRSKSEASLEILDRGMGTRLTLILTPDGSPDVLNRWLATRSTPRVRLELTAVDNSPAQFVSSLTSALRPLAQVPEPAKISSESELLDATAELLNALLDVEDDFALILENYHVITAPRIHGAVALMVEYPPPCLHLYLASCTVPPLPLPRLRARQQLVEIDLRRI